MQQKIIFSDTVFAQEVDGEMVLLDMQSENYFGLDEVGCVIWQAMQEKPSLQDVYELMLETFEVNPERLQKDLLEFVGQLRDAGLLELQ